MLGTTGILRALAINLQGQASPIFQTAVRQQAQRRSWRLTNFPWVPALFVVLLLAGPLLALIDQGGVGIFALRDQILIAAAVVCAGLLSLCWTLPVAALAGQGVALERTARTWDTLLLTPHSPAEIALIKTAASLRPVWWLASGSRILGVFLGVSVFIPAILFSLPLIELPPAPRGLSMIALIAVGMVGMLVDRAQELALSAVTGLTLGGSSPPRAFILGGLGGLMVRLVPILLTLVFIRSTEALTPFVQIGAELLGIFPQNESTLRLGLSLLLVILAGPVSLLAFAPGLPALALVGAFLGLRELLIRVLFSRAEARG